MPCSTNFWFRKLKRLTWTTFGFKRTGPHSQRNNRSFAHRFRKSNNQPKFWRQLAALEMWFDPVGLFFVREPFRVLETRNRNCHSWVWSRSNWKCTEKLGSASQGTYLHRPAGNCSRKGGHPQGWKAQTRRKMADEMAWWADREMDLPPNPGARHLAEQKARGSRLLVGASALRPWLF